MEDIITEKLSPREKEVLGYIFLGWLNVEIANECCITEGTVKSHIQAILRKMSVDGGRTRLMARRIQDLEQRIQDLEHQLQEMAPRAVQRRGRYRNEH